MNENKGLYQKYIITRTDGKPLSPGRRFVLNIDSSDPQEARAVKAALVAYTMFIRGHNPVLAEDLKKQGYSAGDEPNVERQAMQERIAKLEEALRHIRDWDRMLIDPPVWQDGLLKDRRHFTLEDARRIASKALLED